MVELTPGDSNEPQLSTLKYNWQKIILIIFFIISMVILSIYAFNIPAYKDVATSYWTLDLMSIIIILTSFTLSSVFKIGDLYKPILYEEKAFAGKFSLPKNLKVILFFTIPLIIGIYFFFTASTTPSYQIATAPSYQIIEPSSSLGLLLDIVSTYAEDFLMWVTLLPFTFFLVKFLLDRSNVPKSFWVAFVITLFLFPVVWTIYHTAHYGLSDIVSTQKVYMTGVIWTGWTMFTGNPLLPVFMHAGNNGGLDYGSVSKTSEMSFLMWILILLVIIATVFYLRRQGNKP